MKIPFRLVGTWSLAIALSSLSPVMAVASKASCAEELPIIKAEIDAMSSNSDKNLAQHQYERAQERLAAGKEESCLRYVGSARAAIEAWRMHDN